MSTRPSVLLDSEPQLCEFRLFFSFFRRALNILFGTMTTLTIRLLHTAPSNSDLTTLVITADAEISRKIVEHLE